MKGLLNDKDLKIKFYLDKDFLKNKQIIGIHPNDNTATIFLKVEDLIKIIKTTYIRNVIRKNNHKHLSDKDTNYQE